MEHIRAAGGEDSTKRQRARNNIAAAGKPKRHGFHPRGQRLFDDAALRFRRVAHRRRIRKGDDGDAVAKVDEPAPQIADQGFGSATAEAGNYRTDMHARPPPSAGLTESLIRLALEPVR